MGMFPGKKRGAGNASIAHPVFPACPAQVLQSAAHGLYFAVSKSPGRHRAVFPGDFFSGHFLILQTLHAQ